MFNKTMSFLLLLFWLALIGFDAVTGVKLLNHFGGNSVMCENNMMLITDL